MNTSGESSVPTQGFVTATLPGISGPAATVTLAPPGTVTPVPTFPPVEGITTTQINVRSEPSTIGDSLGTIAPFSKVQILGRESNGAWFQIEYASSTSGKGWVTALYVQVDAAAEIPIVETGTGANGLVIQPIKIRSGPGTAYDTVGTLSPNDLVTVTGKNTGGDWMQIKFGAGSGWVASQYLKTAGADSLPVIADAPQSGPAAASTESRTPIPAGLAYIQDNDSKQSPSASIHLSSRGVGAAQFSGSISSSHGDAEDWLQFTAEGAQVLLEVECADAALQVEVWHATDVVAERTLSCEENRLVEIQNGQSLWLRIVANGSLTLQLAPYVLRLELLP